MNGSFFASLQATISWCSCVPVDAWATFIDLTSLLQFVTSEVRTTADIKEEERHAREVGVSPEQSTVVAAFQTVFPAALGSRDASVASAAGASATPALFCYMQDAKSWNPKDNMTGQRQHITDMLSPKVENLKILFSQLLSTDQDAQSLSKFLLQAAWNSWKHFGDNIESFYSFLVNITYGDGIPSATDSAICWDMVLRLCRCFFQDLHKVRVLASSASQLPAGPTRTGTYLWATLQAYRITAEYEACNYYQHPSFATVLQLHMYKTYVQRGDLLSMKTRFTQVETSAKKAVEKVRALDQAIEKRMNKKKDK